MLIPVLVFCCCLQADAGPIHGIKHYISTHKTVLVSDAVVLLAWNADAASTARAIHFGAVESNPIQGIHPSGFRLWGYDNGMALATIAGNHLLWRLIPHTGGGRFTETLPAAATATAEYFNVLHNVRVLDNCERLHCTGVPAH